MGSLASDLPMGVYNLPIGLSFLAKNPKFQKFGAPRGPRELKSLPLPLPKGLALCELVEFHPLCGLERVTKKLHLSYFSVAIILPLR